ncbi:MAG: hypothetical protein JKY10_10155 [Cohaesibacteraceae bacterium]|nr:hypothetical protein [Cohaesibacteraceae bacterium]
MNILLVTIANSDIGFGHLNRCLSIASIVADKNVVVEFTIFGDDSVSSIMDKTCYKYSLSSSSDLLNVTNIETTVINNHFDVALIDLIHPSFFYRRDNTDEIFRKISEYAHIVVVIDSLGEQSLAVQLPNATIDILVVPYALDESSLSRINGVGIRQIHGTDYALLSSAYLSAPLRVARENANRILVTCGGSDPTEMSLIVLEGLELLESQIEIHVVIGPLFKNILKAKIEVFRASSLHKITLVVDADNLAGHMLWCDIAISASGLTKYELAATGTPAIVVSVDTKHELDNRPFAALGTAIDMGVSPPSSKIAEKTFKLLNNLLLRESMMQTGLKLFDGKGALRLMAEIMKELKCKRKT